MKVLILTGSGDLSNAVANSISQVYDNVTLIMENKVKRSVFLKKRIKRLGLFKTIGQIIFMTFVPGYLLKHSQARIKQIADEYGLDFSDSFYSRVCFYKVESVNEDKTINIIRNEAPDIIVINGTRIIAKKVLDCVDVPFINMHTGITPLYRGVHGGYWAAAQDDWDHFGVTVHMVSAGIDTGDVICQRIIKTEPEDNFVTYPYLQTGEGIRMEIQILNEFEKTGKIPVRTVDLPSKLWFHPTIWEYMKYQKRKRVRNI